MTTERRQAKALDGALKGAGGDDATRPLKETADTVRDALMVDVPPADRQRALFLSAISARERPRFSPLRVLAPVLAIGLLVLAMLAGGNALPGQQLYPIREAMNAVGIGETALDELDEHLHVAAGLIRQGESAIETNPERAVALAVRALERLGAARALVPELDGERAEERLDQIENFRDEAVDLIDDALDAEDDAAEEAEEAEGSSAPDRDDEADSSGSGSGTDDDDSGSGSDDSGGDDDNRGSGSDDSGGDDDDSGSGSDDSGGDDDNSGSGS